LESLKLGLLPISELHGSLGDQYRSANDAELRVDFVTSMTRRSAVHKLIVYGERPLRERTKATKDLLQAAAIIEWCLANDRKAELQAAWEDAIGRGRG
jgi:hypothetical protein